MSAGGQPPSFLTEGLQIQMKEEVHIIVRATSTNSKHVTYINYH